MCGINGIAYTTASGRRVSGEVLSRMRDTMIHRGPDGDGLLVEGNIGLGHRRLSIVDVAAGAQPMFNEDGRLAIVYNGEIFNHTDFREELTAKGHVYKTRCDTETILHLFEEYGKDCVHRLRGMFAFAIWDAKDRSLFIARDRFGVKPLYYIHDDAGNLFFGSEIKSLLAVGSGRGELNYGALPDQFANHGISSEQTLFRGVKRLLPGHLMTWRDGELSVERYWDLSFEPKFEGRSEADLIEEWRELFRESVRLRLMSDVPLGMFLSGGIDSSAIAAMMSAMADGPVKTFSVAFAEKEANELRYARMAAERFGTEHHEITVSGEEFFSTLPSLVWHEDEPLGFDSSIPLYFVSKLAAEHVKVVLTGEGSDEVLAGYGRYAKALALLRYGRTYEAAVPAFVRNAVKAGVEALPEQAGRLRRTFLTRPADFRGLFFDNFSIFGDALQGSLFSDEAIDRIGGADPYAFKLGCLGSGGAREPLDTLLYSDVKTYLHELLMRQDQISMATSIESRVPFLDHKLVEFSSRLPSDMKLRDGTGKWILREAMKDLLPPEIISRPKMGFPVPLAGWLRNEFRSVVDEYVLSERASARGLFRREYIERLVAEHVSGLNHTERLFRLINFEIWLRQFVDGETAAGKAV